MTVWAIFRFELGYQVRRVWPWLIFAVVLVLSFLMARDHSLADALYEDFFANSSFAVAKTTVFGGLLWLLLAGAVAGEAAARDVATGMYPLTYTAPAGKLDYLGGRFLAAFALNAFLLLAVQAGIVLGVYSPGVEAQVIGPFRSAAFLTAYAFVALPNAFVATALQFSLALRTGRATAGYLASLFLVFLGYFVATLLRVFVDPGLGSLLDPVGIQFIVEDLAHEWTTVEKSRRLLALEGRLLANRLLWTGIGVAVLAATYLGFRFAHRAERSPLAWLRRLRERRWRRGRDRRVAAAPAPAGMGVTAGARISVPRVPRAFGWGAGARRTLAVAGVSFRAIARSWGGIALLVVVPLVTVVVVLDQMAALGAPVTPTTALVLRELTGGLATELAAEPNRWMIVPLFIVSFAGELVWRERDAGLGEITDAVPGSEWVPVLGKLLGLGLVLALFMAGLAAAGMLAQIVLGYRELEIGLYLKVLFGLQLPEYLLFAVLAVGAHVVVDQKYVGHLVAILAYAFIAVLAAMLGIEHDLLVYGTGPGWSYTEMRGFGASIGAWAWFKAYWAAWAILLAVAARLLWVRGKEGGLPARLRLARRRFGGATAWTATVAAGLVLALGGWIVYNTHVLGSYLSSSEAEERRAEYERRYRRYASVPQPELTEADLRVEIFPERRAVEIDGSYRLVNGGAVPIDSIHLATAAGGIATRAVRFDRAATLTVRDHEHGHRIYALGEPLRPGEALRLDFEVDVERRGFGDRTVDRALVPNGSYFTDSWLPAVGYQRRRELLSPGDRRAHGLEPRPLLASLHDTEGRGVAGRGGGIELEAVVGTAADRVAVALGALRRTWTEGGRRYFHYAADAPIGSEWAFFSARYAVHDGRWEPAADPGQAVAIRIFHHPEHTGHLERVLRAVRDSLEYYGEAFGPYPYRHLTVVEHPGAPGTGLHADAGLISHGEGFTRWHPREEPGSLDLPYAVMGHEMAHQWTLPYALVEGLPFLSEGLAWYSAIQLVAEALGGEQLRGLLAFMRRPYPFRPIRRGEPLLRALDPYLAYRRGPFAMYALSEYVGSDRVNGAIRRLIEIHEAPGAPPATTLDLYRELRAVTPDSLRYLLRDLFEANTYWHFEAESARAVETGPGRWRVTLDVRARKQVYDSAGVETEVAMDEWVPVGVFGPPAPGGDALGAPLYLEMHRIRSGEQTITLTVPREPALAGIDPHHLLDWEAPGDADNLVPVSARAGW